MVRDAVALHPVHSATVEPLWDIKITRTRFDLTAGDLFILPKNAELAAGVVWRPENFPRIQRWLQFAQSPVLTFNGS